MSVLIKAINNRNGFGFKTFPSTVVYDDDLINIFMSLKTRFF